MTCVLASELFEWLPGGGLGEPAEPGETIREYCSRISHQPGTIGDSIFDYLISELTDIDRAEAIGYVDSAIGDLFAIRAQLVATSAEESE